MNVFLRNKSLHANNVDLSRVARGIKKQFNVPSTDEAFELVAKILGFENAHQLRQAAKNTSIAGLSERECQELLGHRFASDGERFPLKGLQSKFNTKWQQDAMHLLNKALSSIPDGACEIVAVVGSAGAGKTLLLNNAVAATKGVRLNIQNWDFFRFSEVIQKMRPEGVFALDQNADATLPLAFSGESWMGRFAPGAFQTLDQFAKATRVRHDKIPGEDSMLMIRGQLHAMLENKPKVRLCMSFASNDEAVNALNATGWQVSLGNTSATRDNWLRVHIVNLDTMTLTTHDNAGQKRYAQRA